MEKNGSLAELDMVRLQEALERERRRRKITHLEEAAELGVSDATVRQWRRGFGMNGDTALRLALLLRVDLRDFAVRKPPADLVPATPMRPDTSRPPLATAGADQLDRPEDSTQPGGHYR